METRIAYLRAVNGLPIEIQREMAEKAGCALVFEHGDVRGQDSRELWIKRFRNDPVRDYREIAWVPRLDVLIKTKTELGKVRPSVDLFDVLFELQRRNVLLVDAARDIDSADRGFPDAVNATLRAIHNSRRNPVAVHKALDKAREEWSRRGIVTKWRSRGMRAQRIQQLAIWQSLTFTTDADAIAALHPELAQLSPASIRRIFGVGRRPKLKGVGGRPKGSASHNLRR